MHKPFKILIIGHSELFRTGIKHMLLGNLSCCGYEVTETDTVFNSISIMESQQPDILIVDFGSFIWDFEKLDRDRKARISAAAIVALTEYVENTNLFTEVNFSAFLLKCCTSTELNIVLKRVLSGEKCAVLEYPASNQSVIDEFEKGLKITKREKEILNLLLKI